MINKDVYDSILNQFKANLQQDVIAISGFVDEVEFDEIIANVVAVAKSPQSIQVRRFAGKRPEVDGNN